MTPFRTWVDDQHHAMAAKYRRELIQTINMFLHYMNGYAITDSAREVCIDALRAVQPPGISRYEGEVSAEDKAWYLQCRKPDWSAILAEYEGRVNKLNVAGSDAGK